MVGYLSAGFHNKVSFVCVLSMMTAAAFFAAPVRGSDHGDAALLIQIGRHDARITDLHAFVRGESLVLSVGLNPAVPQSAADYRFATDLTVQVFIDNDSEVTFDDPDDLREYGGTIVEPHRVKEDIAFRVRFDEDGTPLLHMRGLPEAARGSVRLFTGLRDDPFIRGPRIGRNVAGIVLELPLPDVLKEQSTLLIWATSKLEDIRGPFQDMVGRSLRSMFAENDLMNVSAPHRHEHMMGVPPDVIVYDTSRPAAFPNGRELADDVVDLVGDRRVLADDAPFPSANDVSFLTHFPYLAPPHPPRP
jgi:hypothetical protein